MKLFQKIFLASVFFLFALTIILTITHFKSSDNHGNGANSSNKSSANSYPTEDINKYSIQRGDQYSYDFLKDNTEILGEISKLKKRFDLESIGASLPLARSKLTSGEEFVLISGCEAHNCGGTQTIIAFSEAAGETYILEENENLEEGYEILGNPPEDVKKLLIYYYINGS